MNTEIYETPKGGIAFIERSFFGTVWPPYARMA
jgi:hypothetical protein